MYTAQIQYKVQISAPISRYERNKEILDALPMYLRTEIALFAFQDIIQDVRFFRERLPHAITFVAFLASHIRSIVRYGPGENVATENRYCFYAAFLVRGRCAVVKSGRIVCGLEKDAVFGVRQVRIVCFVHAYTVYAMIPHMFTCV